MRILIAALSIVLIVAGLSFGGWLVLGKSTPLEEQSVAEARSDSIETEGDADAEIADANASAANSQSADAEVEEVIEPTPFVQDEIASGALTLSNGIAFFRPTPNAAPSSSNTIQAGEDEQPQPNDASEDGGDQDQPDSDEQPEEAAAPVPATLAFAPATAQDFDDAELNIKRLGFVKGEHFNAQVDWNSISVYSALDRAPAWDPIWNQRFSAVNYGYQNVQAPELTILRASGESRGWQRYTHDRWVDRNEDYYAGWDVPHSPHFAGGRLRWLRYRRVETNAIERFQPDEYFTQYEDLASGRELARLPNLADAPRPHPDASKPYVLFRVFRGGGVQSEYQLWRLPLLQGEQAKLVSSFKWDAYPVLSHPTWVGPNKLVFIRAKELVGGEEFYSGELVELTLSGLVDPIAAANAKRESEAEGEGEEAGEGDSEEDPEAIQTELELYPLPLVEQSVSALDSGLYPVESSLDTLLFNPTKGVLAAVKAKSTSGNAREVVLYSRYQAEWYGLLADMIDRKWLRDQSALVQMLPALRRDLRVAPGANMEERALAVWQRYADSFRAKVAELRSETAEKDSAQSDGDAKPAKQSKPTPPKALAISLPDLVGIWRGDACFELINGTQVLRLSMQGELQEPRKGAVARSGVQGTRDLGAGELSMPGVLLVMGSGTAANGAVGDGFAFELLASIDGDGLFADQVVSLSDQAEAKAALPGSAWINENNASRKIIAKLLADNALQNTVMTYDYKVLVEQEGIKNAQGSMLELYQREYENRIHRSKFAAMIRTEDNLGGNWVTRAFDGTDARLAFDAKKTFEKSEGDTKDKLQAQLEARKLLLLMQDPEQAGEFHTSTVGYQVLRDPESGKTWNTLVFVTRTAGGHVARMWFDADGEHHDLVAVFLRFPLGNDSRQIKLLLDEYGELKDLRGKNKSLRVPYRVRGFNTDDNTHVFTAKLLGELARPTSSAPIASGYNSPKVSNSVFSESYALD